MTLLVLRPRVGALATARRAAAAGHAAVVAPLFSYRALDWAPPAFSADAVLLTSAATVRFGGEGLMRYRTLPAFAVGTATADAARAAGFGDVRAGRGDVRDAIALLAADGYRHVLHPAGRDHVAVDPGPVALCRVAVYAADAVDRLPAAVGPALDDGAVVLVHSPRAARTFAALLDAAGIARSRVGLACFSPAVAAAAGGGWARVGIADRPDDDALFAAANMLCDQDGCGTVERR